MKLYGEEKTDAEIIAHVREYVAMVQQSKTDRFHGILALFPDGQDEKVLDYGCGWGHYAVALREKGYQVSAIDLSQNEIDICRRVWGERQGITFERTTVDTFSDAEFDYVLSVQVIEHVHNTGHYLSQINRVLKIGGYLVIALPNIMNPRHFLGLLAGDLATKLQKISTDTLNSYDKTHDHIHAWDPTHFVRLVASVGFAFESFAPLEGVPFPARKPFKPYLHVRSGRFRHLSYTMAFRFRKVAEKRIASEA